MGDAILMRVRARARLVSVLAQCAVLPLLVGCGVAENLVPVGDADFEVWVVDQSDTPGAAYGGTLYVYAGSDLHGDAAGAAAPAARIDLGAETTAMCVGETGAEPVRPHMVLFDAAHRHALIAFVVSGHVVVMDAASRVPIACLRTSRSATGQQAHAAFPSPDGSYVLVANQNGKRLERIDTDFAERRFTPNMHATLDLAACTTPSGAPCQAPELRPDNAPICPVIDATGDLAFVTLRGGGLLVVDPRATPMRIVAEYDMATVNGNGCGGVEVNGRMYVNSGGRPGPLEHLHLYGFDVYQFELDAFRANGNGAFAVNEPPPLVVFEADGEHDSHGMVATRDGAYLWVMDRHADVAEVLSTVDGRHVNTVALNGELTTKASPDLADIAPSNDRIFVALRGPTPLSGDPHIATGSTPGLGIIELTQDGRDGRLSAIVRVTNIGADGVERADPHAVRVRRLP
jgi:hypothetical protein